jgi:hypothetical protein
VESSFSSIFCLISIRQLFALSMALFWGCIPACPLYHSDSPNIIRMNAFINN